MQDNDHAHDTDEDLRQRALAEIGRHAVAIRFAGLGGEGEIAGSGLLVGPDLVLTCDHLVRQLYRGEYESAADHMGRIESARIELGISADGRSAAYVLRLHSGVVDENLTGLWRMGPEPPQSGFDDKGYAFPHHDFAFLRLSGPRPHFPVYPPDPQRPRADWVAMHNLFDRERLHARGNLTTLRLAMVHFPVLANGAPGYRLGVATGSIERIALDPKSSALELQMRDLVGEDLPGADTAEGDQPATDLASSGAVMFGYLDDQFFPLAVHLGRKGLLRYALPLDYIKSRVDSQHHRELHKTLSRSVPEGHRAGWLKKEGQAAEEAAVALIDQTWPAAGVADAAVKGRMIYPVLTKDVDSAHAFIDRVRVFELPETTLEQRKSHAQKRLQMKAWPGCSLMLPPESAAQPVLRGKSFLEQCQKFADMDTRSAENFIDQQAESVCLEIGKAASKAAGNAQSYLFTIELPLRGAKDVKHATDLIRAIDLHLLKKPKAAVQQSRSMSTAPKTLLLVLLIETEGAPLAEADRHRLLRGFGTDPGPGTPPAQLQQGMFALLRRRLGLGAAHGGSTGSTCIAPVRELEGMGRSDLDDWQAELGAAFFEDSNPGRELGPKVDRFWTDTFPEPSTRHPHARVKSAMLPLIQSSIWEFIERRVNP